MAFVPSVAMMSKMLNFDLLSVTFMSVTMLNVDLQSVIWANVVVPMHTV